MSLILRAGGIDRPLVRVAHISTNSGPNVVDLVRATHRGDLDPGSDEDMVRNTPRTAAIRDFLVGNGRVVHRSALAGPRE